MKQKAAAKVTGISASYASKLANGEIEAKTSKAKKFMELLSAADDDSDMIYSIIEHPDFGSLCMTGIGKSRSVSVRMLATSLYHLHLKLSMNPKSSGKYEPPDIEE